MKTPSPYPRVAVLTMLMASTIVVSGCSEKNPASPTIDANTPGTPVLAAPSDGKVMRTKSRPLTFSWSRVPQHAAYTIEIETRNGSDWAPFQIVPGLTSPSYALAGESHDYVARWRVWAVSSIGVEGAKSGWRTVRVNTDPEQYVGTWSSKGRQAAVIGRLANGDLDVQIGGMHRSAPFTEEPLVLTNLRSPDLIETTSITLADDAGTTLKVEYSTRTRQVPSKPQTVYYSKGL